MGSIGLASADAALTALLPAGPRPAPCARDLQRGPKLRLFVYPLDWAYAGQIVDYVESKARSLLGVKCSYLREDTCPNTGFSHLENLRSHCTDVPIMYKLLQAARIEPDAEKADVFVVPFLMGCNAMLGWGHGMQRVNAKHHHAFFGDFARFAREQLPHFAKYPHRHLFLFPLDSMFAPKWLRGSMLAHTGSGYISSDRLDVPVPYLVSLPTSSLGPIVSTGTAATRANLVFLMASPSRNKDTMARMRDTTFCVAPTGDSDGFTQRFYYIIAAGCIPVRIDTYYPKLSFGRVAWPSKQTINWRKAVVLLPPERLRRDGLLPTLANISDAQIARMREYIARVVRPHVLFDYRGRAPDAFSAFLDELLHLSKTRLPRMDKKLSRG